MWFSKTVVETVPPKEEESGKDFSAADALSATQAARDELEYQMNPVYVAIKHAAKQGKTGCVVFGESKSWSYIKWKTTDPTKFDSNYIEQIVCKLKELGYQVKEEYLPISSTDDYKLTISWGDKDD